MKKLILFGMTVALLASCVSTEKLLERGNYEDLITKASRKLAGNKKKDQLVLALEDGYKKLSAEVMINIESNKNINTAESWESILHWGYHIEKLQNRIKPLLPLVSENGHRARFDFIGTAEIISEAKKAAAALYHTRVIGLSDEAYAGNKPAARKAYHLIDRINSLSDEYDLVNLKDEMYHAGINKIWVTVENRSFNHLPYGVTDDLLYVALNGNASNWNRFYTDITEADEMDYKVSFRIHDLRAEPEQYRTIENKYRKEITDGWEYVLDANGNVAKDSLGNDIKRERRIKVHATLVETNVSKRAYIDANMEVINLKTGFRSLSLPLFFEEWFNHTARNYYGDPRALEANLTSRIAPVHCPDDISMMLRVAEKAKRAFTYEVNRASYN